MTLTYHSTDIDPRLQLVDFTHATPDTLTSAIKDALTAAHQFLDALEDTDNTTNQDNPLTLIEAFDELALAIYRPFGVLSHLNSVVSSDEIRHAHHEVLPQISAFGVRVGQSFTLYQLYQALDASLPAPSDSDDLDTIARRRSTQLALQNFALSGVNLPKDAQQTFADIQSRLSLLSAQFADNVLDSTAAFALPLTQAQTAGLTKSGLALLAAAGERYKQTHPNTVLASDYVATLDIPSYLAVMQYADDRTLRQTLYHAYGARASDVADFFGEKDGKRTNFDNGAIMGEILALRSQKAALLGFDTYTDVSLATKMADSHAQIEHFLLDLAAKARPHAEKDLQDVAAFAKTLGIDDVQPWDVPYISEKLRAQKYQLDSEALRAYFPLPVVLDGLFAIIGKLFGVTFHEKTVPTWHKDVQFFEVHDDSGLLGGVYIDVYARNGKRGGAWLSGFQNRHCNKACDVLPVGFIVGNFTPKVGDTDSLLTHDEVLTLFHEFGHGLHHLLTKVGVNDVAGIDGVEWDAVELPSQFMENFAWDEDGIALISRHIDTGEPLPADKLAAMLAAKHFQSGLQTLRQIEFALFDLRIHSGNLRDFHAIMDVLHATRQEVAVVMPPATNRFANSFSHIFAGGYAAGYYSYKWAELLSADAFGVFEAAVNDGADSVLNAELGQKFYDEILAKGGARPAKENFIAFAGREAQIDALLRHSGFAAH
ncbi:oligopeptidase A [Moraxella caviae]|uniref:oligopeptidase A n=1 Tax=Moraxella caviae TaxID=34060 RepID=A0A1T0A7K1_9GAMM|nr:M3 family metallopeptidase [Moraxella caviae]OOR91677.1 oligopeptidase A [Moraxella caviae]STZ10404.1 Oligopeptidase A [Moraxella caviae]